MLEAVADEVQSLPDGFQALETWLQAFVRYADTKRSLLSELHEAFERNPDLKVQLRERLLAAAGRVLDRAKADGRVRDDLTGADLLQLVGGMCMSATATLPQNERLLSYVLAGIRAD